MKKPSNHLFKLIKSLTKSEKRAFRLNPAYRNEAKKYIAIFEAIDAQTEYDEEALKKKFKKEKWINRFNSAKEYVYKTLLNNLVIYNQKHEPHFELADLLVHIRVLQMKGFYEKCKKLIEKGKVLANEIDDYQKVLELYHLESINHPGGINPVNRSEILKQQKKTLQLLDCECTFNWLYKLSYQIFSKTGYAGFTEENIVAYRKIFDAPEMRDYKKALTFNSKRMFNNMHYFYALGTDNRNDMERWVMRTKDLFDQNPKYIKLQPVNYATTLLNVHDFYLKQGNFEKALEILKKLRSFHPKEKLKEQERLTYIIEYGALHNEITTLNTMGKFQKSAEKINLLEVLAQKHQLEISESIYVRHLYLIAATYFGINDFKSCKKTLDTIFEIKNTGFRSDLIKRSKIMLFLVYFELGKFDLLEYNVRSVKRFMSRNGELNDLEQQLFKLVNHLLDGFANKEAAKKVLSRLYIIQKNKKYVPNYSEILDWVEGKLTGISYAKIVEKKQ